ncbi:MAG TPA: ribonuclease H-like domain-containing protein, partial [Bacillales bacterium]|nr:ribonuclease H-like domain-containing protein [Bacillales bacterium]
TYNGKSFDWPQVKTRHTLVRDHVPKLPSFGHFDLYHAARRLWKHKLEKLKLAIVEKEILGVERVEDIPGFLAPMIYFDFVESKNPEGMIGVLKHNEIDILSLITLYTHLTFQINGQDPTQTRNESFEVGRWFDHLGEKTEAKQVFTRLAGGNDKQAVHAKHALAFQHKKEHDWAQALGLFEEVANSANEDHIKLEACIEAAKILEHKNKNYDLAIKYCQKAMRVLDQGFFQRTHQTQLLNRLRRLEIKRKKFPG